MIQLTISGSFQNTDADVQPENQAYVDVSLSDSPELFDAGLPPELAKELEAINSFSDKALWKTARSRLTTKAAQKLRQLNHKQQKYGQPSLTQL